MVSTVLKKLLEQSGKTQKEVAHDLGLNRQRFNFYVTGKREPDHEMLRTLSDYFHVPVDYLVGNGIYGQLLSIPNLRNILTPIIENQFEKDFFKSLLKRPLSDVDDVTFGEIASLLIEKIETDSSGNILVYFKS